MRTVFRYPFAVLAAAMLATPARAAEFAPYRAAIVSPSAAVRSGPGENFYETDTLAEGDVVDIYREQANGWCAIRPPEGSFSWVFGRHLSAVEMVVAMNDAEASGTTRVAQVEKSDVASRIGSRLSSQKNAVQVRLKQGETVRILGEEEIDGQTWYKIAPPAGEFRWIHKKHLRSVGSITAEGPSRDTQPNSAPTLAVATAMVNESTDANTMNVTPTAATGTNAPPIGANARYPELTATPQASAPQPASPPLLLSQESPVATATPPVDSPAKPSDSWHAATNPIPATPNTGPAATAVPTASLVSPAAPNVANPLTHAAPTSPTVANSPAPPAAPITPVTPITAANTPPTEPPRSLTEVELRLSRMVAEPPAAWNLEPLRAETQALLAAAPVVEKSAIQTTIAKIDRFAAIARRYREANGLPAESLVAPDGTRFDAVGVLRPVNSRRPGAPPFALVDERGQVLSFITPTAGMNLQPLVGQRVGVTGNRGFIPEFQRAHVVAGRALPVNERSFR